MSRPNMDREFDDVDRYFRERIEAEEQEIVADAMSEIREIIDEAMRRPIARHSDAPRSRERRT